ncbi:MAG: hypothetical protein HZB42_10890 [Sphingobacteriales bacterium]|nr:hypothetical protein [Sphingobacteriales bacterium]
MRIVLIAILVYLAYQFIFNFLIPVFITTRKIRKGFREMSDRMNSFQTSGNNGNATQNFSGNTTHKVNKADYLDFEEMK